MTAGHRLSWIEAARFSAALAVMIWHYQHFAALAGAEGSPPFQGLLWPLYEHGHYGVPIFWFISGYILCWKYRESILSGKVSGWRFFVLRFSRLYPLHIVTLLAVILLQAAHAALAGGAFVYAENSPANLAAQLFMASGWDGTTHSFNGPIWSISIEILVYALFFLGLRAPGSKARLEIWIALGALGLMAAGVDSAILTCIACFYAGSLACRLLGRRGAPQSHGSGMPGRAVAAAGNLTYACYLLHFPVQLIFALGYVATGTAPDLGSPVLLLGFVGATLAASHMTYRHFERPMQNMLRDALLQMPAVRSVPA